MGQRNPNGLMVVSNLNVVKNSSHNDEADAILIVDSNAMLSLTVSTQNFQMISGHISNINQSFGLFK